jgi:S1-C subfamily serine protease
MNIKTHIFIIILIISVIFNKSYSQNITDVIENSLGAVVTVVVYEKSYAKKSLGYRGEKGEEEAYKKVLDLSGALASGSGFAIQRNGKIYIVTNAHVVETASEKPGSIYIFSISRKKYEVKVRGGDSFYDIAILEFVDKPGSEITTLEFKKEPCRIGETVFAIGNPLGEYPYSVTNGIISAKNRVRSGRTGKFGFLQTTATVIWGNSGGPLIDVNGRVAGINSQLAFATAPNGTQIWQSQINFALENEICIRLVNDILNNNGRVLRSFFGLEITQKFQYQSNGTDNSYLTPVDDYPVISEIIPNSPAANVAEQYKGYYIIAINNNEVNNIEEALGELEKTKPNQGVKFTVKKLNEQKDFYITGIELKNFQLEQIARFVVAKDPKISVDVSDQQVVISKISDKFYKYQDKKYVPSENFRKELPRNSQNIQEGSDYYKKYYEKDKYGNYTYYDSKFYLLAAGIYSENDKDIWRVEDYSDFGAALKLSGLAGVIDLYLHPDGGKTDDVELYRIYLGDKEDEEIQSTLWY